MDGNEMAITGKSLSRFLHLLLGVGIAALFLHLALRDASLAAVGKILAGIDPRDIPPLVGLSLVILCLRVWRWLLMFEHNHRPARQDAFAAFAVSSLANSLMPGRLGDVMRAGMIGRRVPALGASGAFATVILEKVFDGSAVLVLLGAALWLAPLPAWIVDAGRGAAAAFAAVFALLFVLRRSHTPGGHAPTPDASGTLASRVRSTFGGLLHRFRTGLALLTSPGQMLAVLLASIAIWCCEVWLAYLCFGVFRIPAPPQAAVVTIALLAVGTMLPAAPGFVGTYQFFVVSALALFAVPENAALAVSVFMNSFAIAMTVLAAILAGFSALLVGRPSEATGH